ncbi:MAG: sterol desaturase family protein [Thiotrichales bacterium]|nr:sterol desaturase family protein [Thiotrichales bacterium]
MPDIEITIRLGAFLVCLAALLCWEQFFPRRKPGDQRWLRRVNNLALIVIAIVIIQFLLPLLALLGIADLTASQSWGLFNYIGLPVWLEFLFCIIILDLVIYWQHRLFHKYPLLWRMHRVHHSDPEVDVTTAIRFHPLELIISLTIKALVVIMLGAPAIAVLVFELLLNLQPMFNHSNIRIPEKVDRYLRWFIVTPDMHRVHHSQIKRETNSNYCFNLSCWDRLFNSYNPQPQAGHRDMKIGLKQYKGPETILLHNLLAMPFRRTPV